MKKLIAVLLLVSSSAFAQLAMRVDKAEKVVNGLTSPLPGAWIKVCQFSEDKVCPDSAVIPIFKDPQGTKPQDNPFRADKDGNFQYFFAFGNYVEQVTYPGYTYSQYMSALNASGTIPEEHANCSANQYANAIAVNGDLTCSQVAYGQVSGTPVLATVATSGSYNDLSDKPSIPTLPTLATVATTGSYTDLISKPTIPAAQVQSDWTASSGMGVILNKPTLATVATSGSYNDLSNKPTIPTIPSAKRICEIHIWGSGASGVLLDTDDEAASCYNGFGVTETVTGVTCWANAGSPTINPVVTGGSALLSSPLTCGTASFSSGTLSGTPTLASAGSVDANVTTAGGTATNIRIAITLTRAQ